MSEFRVTQKVDIIVDDPESAKRQVYFSRIEDVGRDFIAIAAPYRRGFYLPPYFGRLINARVTSESCAFLFKSKLIRYVTEPIPMWIIEPPTNLKKVQMRSYVRLSIVLDVMLELPDAPEENNTITTLTRDISAGGVRVVVAKPLGAGTKVKVVLPLPGVGTIEAAGEVIRDIYPEVAGDRHAAAIEFTDIKEKTRGEIVKFIFRKQVERRKKELELFE